MEKKIFGRCHDGEGEIEASIVFQEGDLKYAISFMHDDIIPPGTSIGEHKHADSEEIYFIIEGHGVLILDGREFPVEAGDVSICHSGHSHGIKNNGNSPLRLIVIGLKK